MANLISPQDILRYYCRVLDRLFGMYIDACTGFRLYAQQMSSMAASMNTRSRALPILFLGPEVDDPNHIGATYYHSETADNVIERNKTNGDNQTILAHSLIVFAYSVWDSDIRSAYSASIGKEQKEVTSDAMGDLRAYRNAIIHSNLKLERTTKKFTFIAKDDAIILTEDQVTEMLAIIFDDLSGMHNRLTGENAAFLFNRPLNRK